MKVFVFQILAFSWLVGCSDSGLPTVGGLKASFGCPCPADYECDFSRNICVVKGFLAADIAKDTSGATDLEDAEDAANGDDLELTDEVAADVPIVADVVDDAIKSVEVADTAAETVDGKGDVQFIDATPEIGADVPNPIEIAGKDADAGPDVAQCLPSSTDSDGDGVADCLELAASCPAGAVKDNTVYPDAPEICDGKDNDCDGKTDENFAFQGKAIAQACGVGACAGGAVVCAGDGKSAVCSSAAKAQAELCNNLDDNCDGVSDEGCDKDGDGFCDAKMLVVGKSNACPNGGGDCNDGNKAINPVAKELCDPVGVDENCNGKIDETCGGEVTCDGKDDNGNGVTDEGCDDDGDGYCDSGMTVIGSPSVCAKSKKDAADDCDDTKKAVNPGAVEICNDFDDNCDGKVDEGCDDDKDGYCDIAMVVVGLPAVCKVGGGDCDDKNAAANPGKVELCSTLFDDNCDGKVNDAGSGGCVNYFKDVDGDSYGQSADKQCLCAADVGGNIRRRWRAIAMMRIAR